MGETGGMQSLNFHFGEIYLVIRRAYEQESLKTRTLSRKVCGERQGSDQVLEKSK